MSNSSLDVLFNPTSSEKIEVDEFSMLWNKITKAEKSYQRAELKRREIFDEFNTIVKPVEESLTQVRYALADELLHFYEKNKVNSKDKQTLREWIEETFDSLHSSPFRGGIDFEGLVDRYYTCHESSVESQQKSDTDEAKHALFSILEELGVFIDDDIYTEKFAGKSDADFKAAFEIFMQEALGGSEQYDDEEEESLNTGNNEYYSSSEEHIESKHVNDEPNTLQEMLSKLYKKVAQKIHPDKARDEVQRQEYHQLMQVLSKAKKDGDIYTILSIIRTHLDHSDVQLTEDQLDSVLDTLERKLGYLRRQRENLKREGTIESAVYNKFNGRGKNAIRQKMDDHCLALKDVISSYEADLKSISTLKQLKIQLKNRRNHVQFFPFLYT